MKTAPAFARFASMALLALMLGLRMLGATGYMPSFEHGSATIIVCPDAAVDAPLAIQVAHHHHGRSKHKHQGPCPFASASAPATLALDFGALLVGLIFGTTLLLVSSPFVLGLNRFRERPPSQGPPFPA